MRVLKPKEIEAMNAIKWWHRIAVGFEPDGETTIYTPGEVNHGPNGGNWPRMRFGIPDNLTGKSVLDIGAWDGFFSFYAEERGAASVVAMDIPEEQGGHWGGATGFDFAKKVLGSKVHFSSGDIQNRILDEPSKAGYSLVLCYGVLYHIENPFIAIENLFNLTIPGGTCLIETAVEESPALQHLASWTFHGNHSGDPTNKWYPTRKGLKETCLRAGFKTCDIFWDIGSRVTARCEK